MTGADIRTLVRLTLFEPHEAARRILALRLPVEVAWMGLALMAVLNTLVYSFSLRLNPPADPMAMGMMGPAFQMPLVFALLLFGGLALTVAALVQVGRILGGQGSLGDMLALMTWMQALRLGVQLGVVVLALVMPALAALAVIVAAIWGAYIMLAFVDAAHGFGSMLRAAGVIVASVVALAVGLSVILGLLGVSASGGI